MRHSTQQYKGCIGTWKSMKVSLWFGPRGRHTLRFDEIELAEISSLMQAISARHPVQISDFRRNILGIWRAGELREAADELVRLERCHSLH